MALASVVHGLFAVDMEHMPLAYGRGAEDLVVRDDLHRAVCVETAGDGALHAAADGLWSGGSPHGQCPGGAGPPGGGALFPDSAALPQYPLPYKPPPRAEMEPLYYVFRKMYSTTFP